jgi:aspartate racemase
MKTIGMIGGMSWESTVTYYQIINETVKEKLGGLHSAKCLLYSVDFHEMEAWLAQGDWESIGNALTDAALRLQDAGADFLVICTNTMHKVTPQMEMQESIPILHIADAAAEALKVQNIRKAALLGTAYTMEQGFYKDRIAGHGIEVIVPEAEDRAFINRVIFQELCLGILSDSSRQRYVDIIGKLNRKGAQGVILGCTEIGLLVKQADTSVPLFDTTVIHARRAADFALAK